MGRKIFGSATGWRRFGLSEGFARLATGSATVFLLTIASSLVGLATQVALTRGLGVQEFGRYAVVVSWCLVLAAPAMAGVDGSILRFASRYISEGKGAQLRHFVKKSAISQSYTVLIIGAAVTIAYVSGVESFGVSLNGVSWLILFLVSTAFLGSFSNLFVAFGRLALAQLYPNIVRPLLLVAAIAYFALRGGADLDAEAALLFTALTSALALALMLLHLFRLLGRFGNAGEAYGTEAWLSFSRWAQLGSIGQQAAAHLPLILLGSLSTFNEAGYFAVAVRLSTLVGIGLSAVAAASAPIISSACGRGDWDEVATFARNAARISSAFAALAFGVLIISGSMLLSIFGPAFVHAYAPLIILLVGVCFTAFSGVNAILLSMTDQPRFAVIAILVGAAVNLSVGYGLIPSTGALGAAIGTALGAFISNLLMSLKIWMTHGLDSTPIGFRRGRAHG